MHQFYLITWQKTDIYTTLGISLSFNHLQFNIIKFHCLAILYLLLDIDECQSDNGGCMHKCNNTIGSYYCSCRHGYELSSDNHICTGRCLYIF